MVSIYGDSQNAGLARTLRGTDLRCSQVNEHVLISCWMPFHRVNSTECMLYLGTESSREFIMYNVQDGLIYALRQSLENKVRSLGKWRQEKLREGRP